MSQATLRAAVIGAMCFVAGCICAAAGCFGAAAICGLVGAAVPIAVLYVRMTS